ncbi:hypothetical protein [Campylobacter concisus]|uniref:hypothetical protein n=1 Tax=Campylobacter concisus TaxID=199 RepID=UPI0011E88A01|nr:hypothetical protein [Campylobacter concisus]
MADPANNNEAKNLIPKPLVTCLIKFLAKLRAKYVLLSYIHTRKIANFSQKPSKTRLPRVSRKLTRNFKPS